MAWFFVDRRPDYFIQKLGERYADGGGRLRIQACFGHTRDGVGLKYENIFTGNCHIGAGHAGAAENFMRFQRVLLDFLDYILSQARRGDFFRRARSVFRVIVKKCRSFWYDLRRWQSKRLLFHAFVQYGASHFSAGNVFLRENGVVVRKSRLYGASQVINFFDDGYTDAGSAI